jgi:outer membrane protein assembly factor BamE (lipoprotein component of BamABCDE complex)
MKLRLFLAVALLATFFCTVTNGQDAPVADKAIKSSIKSLKAALDSTKNAADRKKLTEAIAALEQVIAKKSPLNEGGKKKVYTRAAFKMMVVGKTKDQVRQLLGKPERTTEFNDNEFPVAWHYNNLTRDPDAMRIDPNANILFDMNGVAVSVDFFRFPF